MAPDFDRLARIPCPIASLASSGIKAFNSALDRSCSRKACRVRRKRPANSPGDRPTASRRRARVAAIPGCYRKFSRLPPGAGDTADPAEKQATGAARALNSIRSKRKPNAQDPLIRGKAQRHQTHPRSISQNQSLPKNSAKSLPACSSRAAVDVGCASLFCLAASRRAELSALRNTCFTRMPTMQQAIEYRSSVRPLLELCA